MSKLGYVPLKKLEDESILTEACDLAEYMYSLLADFPEEEKWNTESKLRTEANNLIYYLSQAIGNSSPTNTEYDWGYARRSIVAIKTMYRFAVRQNFVELEPSIMVRLDKIIIQIDAEAATAYKRTETQNQKEIDLWQEKYELFRKTQI